MSGSPQHSGGPPVDVVLCWHMHQPEYRDPITGRYQLPWTYLHAIKDYVDMAVHLEEVSAARAVVNFTPVLLEQLEDYTQQIDAFERNGDPLRDPLLSALVAERYPEDPEQRLKLIHDSLRANEERMIRRFPAFHRLARVGKWINRHPESLMYVNDQYLADLLVWYHLAWMGETVRRQDLRVRRLMEKAHGFGMQDRRLLLHIIGELLEGIAGRYRALAEAGRIELSVTPYAHPIVPLLLDLGSARDAMPDVALPEMDRYPGGRERARWHIDKGREVYRRFFGADPKGCWPAEGSVSEAALRLLEEGGFHWAATGEGVLRNSLKRSRIDIEDGRCIHRAYRPGDGDLACFFRDDGLSDLIGFTYSTWHADDAVGDLINHIMKIADACSGASGTIVSIILDGENAWEHYPENGYYFLRGLYQRLGEHPRINLTTFSDHLAADHEQVPLPRVVAGSWVYGTFSTWIGDKDKNRGWDMLGEAKRVFDQAVAGGALDDTLLEEARRQLAICEGSDWFWWFGDYNDAESVSDFEHLYRHQLTTLYRVLGVEPPDYLEQVFARGHGAPPLGGAMRPGREHG